MSSSTVGLGQGAATGTFFSDPGGTTPVTTVSWSAGSGASVPGPHQATFYYRDTVAGPHTITVSSPTLTDATSNLTVNGAAPAKLGFTTVPSSAADDGTFSVTVQAQDEFGNPTTVTGDTDVTLALESGSGLLNGTLVEHISSGDSDVTFNGLSDHATGSITLSATDTSGAVTPLDPATSPAITITAGSPDHLAFVQQPSDATGGSLISPTVTVELLDQFGNRSASNATVSLSIGTNPGGGHVSGGSVVAVDGLATFPALSIDKAGAGYTLVATSGALPSVTSVPFTISVGPAFMLGFGQQPTDTTAGQTISPPVTVEVQDAGGNLVTNATVDVTLAIGANPGSATLGGTLTRTTVGGVAAFDDLSIINAADGYTLVGSGASLASATSSTFDITADTATTLVFTSSPISAKVNTNSTNLTVQRRDQFGNPVTSGSITVDLSSTAATGEFRDAANPSTAITSVAIPNGSSSASFKYRDSAPGSPTLTASSNGIDDASQTAAILANRRAARAEPHGAGRQRGDDRHDPDIHVELGDRPGR